MRSYKLLTLFFVVTAIYFVGMFFHVSTLNLISKPLIVTSLLIWYLSYTHTCFSRLKKWIILALIFCTMGDTLLMFTGKNELFFLLGLVAFLLGHLFFIIVFIEIKKENRTPLKWHYILFPMLYFVTIMVILVPKAANLQVAITVYALVIVTMLIFALHLMDLRKGGKAIALGAMLFVISDSLLAINKFVFSLNDNGFSVMATYCAAVFLLTFGLGKYTVDSHLRRTSHWR